MRGLVREAGHWSGFLEKFAAAFPHRNVIALDTPGNGQRFREPSPCSIHEMAEKVRAEFLQTRGQENYLFALSLGAMVGLQWMHKYPDDFKSAVLVNTSLKGVCPFYQRMLPKNYGTILRMMFSKDLLFREKNILRMTSQRAKQFPQLPQHWADLQKKRPVSLKNAISQIFAAATFQPPAEKPRTKILLLNSARDELVAPSCSEKIAKYWNVPLKTNPHAGHDITLDEPEWVLEQLRF